MAYDTKEELVRTMINIASSIQRSLAYHPYIYSVTIERLITRFEFKKKGESVAIIHIPLVNKCPDDVDIKRYYRSFFGTYARGLNTIKGQLNELNKDYWKICDLNRIETMVLRHNKGHSFMYLVENEPPCILDLGGRPCLIEGFEKELAEYLAHDQVTKEEIDIYNDPMKDINLEKMMTDLMEKYNDQERQK